MLSAVQQRHGSEEWTDCFVELRPDFDRCAIRHEAPYLRYFRVGHCDATIGPVTWHARIERQAVGLSVNKDQPARRPPAGICEGPVLRIGIIDIQAEIIARLFVTVADRIKPFRRSLVTFELFVTHRRIAILQT